jgi:hypothetical protein
VEGHVSIREAEKHYLLMVAILLLLPLRSRALQGSAHIEGVVSVTVDASKVQNFVAPRAMGMHTSVYDNHLGGQQLAEILRSAGITTLRYPGGGFSDNYHWSLHKMTKSKATDPPQYGYLGPNTDFGHFLQLVEAIQEQRSLP